jgi:hypothetical protein
MQMPASNRDMVLNGWFDFLVPDFMTSSSGAAPSAPVVSTPSDTGSSFWSNVPSFLTAGLNAFTATQLIQNPAIASAMLRPAGVGPVNPYGIPSGSVVQPGITPIQAQYPPGTTFDPYGRPIAPSALPAMMPLILIGGGGLLLIALMMGKR